MNETDRIIAAVFAAGLCQGKPVGPGAYFKAYDKCIEIFEARAAAAKKPMVISAAALANSKEKPRRRGEASTGE